MIKKVRNIIFLIIIFSLLCIGNNIYAAEYISRNSFSLNTRNVKANSPSLLGQTITASQLGQGGMGAPICVEHGASMGNQNVGLPKGVVYVEGDLTAKNNPLAEHIEKTPPEYTAGATQTASDEFAYILAHAGENDGGHPTAFQQDVWSFQNSGGSMSGGSGGTSSRVIRFNKCSRRLWNI